MKINVDICVCLSSTQEIEVPDNYNPENLKLYIEEQIMLPQEVMEMYGYSGWIVDEFCVQ